MMETLVVIGLFAILITLGLFISMDVWRGSSFQSEQDIVISLLYKARSRALSNIGESNHGLYIDTSNREYVLFEGTYSSSTPDNQPFEMNKNFTLTGNVDTEIIFLAREGTTGGYTITMDGQGRSRTFTINNEGGISWGDISF